MHIFRKDQGAARRMPEMAAGEGLGAEGPRAPRGCYLFVKLVSLFTTLTMFSNLVDESIISSIYLFSILE